MVFITCAFQVTVTSVNKITVFASEDTPITILDVNLSLCFLHEKPVRNNALEIYKPASYYDFTTFYSADGKYSAGVQYTLTGGYWYNANTFQVTRTSSPTFNILSIELDTAIQADYNSISTESNNSSGNAYFWGTFELNAGHYLDGVWINDIPFNTCKVSFHATP